MPLPALLRALLRGLALAIGAASAGAHAAPLRVCADQDAPAFEEAVAQVLAQALRRELQLLRMPWRHGFVRRNIGLCDVFVGVPAGFGALMTTRPYYRAGWVALTRADDPAPLAGLEDPRLPRLRIGVLLPPGHGTHTPVGDALVQRGAFTFVRGYPVAAQPVASMLQDLRSRRLDAALLWGPQAAGAGGDLRLSPLPSAGEIGIAVGVHRGDMALLAALQRALDARQPVIDALLAATGVPRTDR